MKPFFSIHLLIVIKHLEILRINCRLVIYRVYGPFYQFLKEAFWAEFKSLSCYEKDLWVRSGDFNVIRFISESRGYAS